jgi:glycosyltransferase involved in cell wall biosynthesis
LPFKKNQVFFDYYGITRIPSILANKSFKKFDIVYYARICEEKGIEDLILAIERLHKNGYTLNVLIIGQSEEKYLNYLKQIILDKNLCKFFTFTGFIDDHQEVFKLASTAKMLVLPSHYDELNNTIREAMFMKLPVVAYNVGGIKEANIYRECITLVEKGNIDDLSEKILLVLNNYDRTLKLINNAYSEMNERYSPHRLYDLTISIYKSILNSI